MSASTPPPACPHGRGFNCCTRWYFHTTCVDSDGPSINAMTAAATQISYATLRKHLGSALRDVERSLGYDVGHARGGLRMSKDWAVSCYRSEYQGKPCLYFAWSHIEHIFLEATRDGEEKEKA